MTPIDALGEILRGRRSVRKFKPDPVPRATIEELLDLAVTAPSASNKQPWRFFVVVNRAVITEMADAVRGAREAIVQAVPEASRAPIAAYGDYFTRFEAAPVVIVAAHRALTILSNLTAGALPESEQAVVEQMEVSSGLIGTSLALGHLLLAAHAMGLGASGMTGPLIARPRLKAIVGIPDSWDIAALVALGFADETPAATERKDARKVVRWIE